MKNPNIVLFDLDGTLADVSERRTLIEKPNKTDADWRAFYAACPSDKVHHAVGYAFHAHRSLGHHVWIVSGRSDEVKPQTETWLRRNGLVPDRLIMPVASDHQPDVKLKRSWMHDGTLPKAQILCVYDDRDSVVAMWREEGLPCFQVAPGNF